MLFYSITFIALLIFVYLIRKPRPVPVRQGTSFNRTSDENLKVSIQAKTQLTVASFNVQTGKSLQGKRDISRAANLVRHVDLVGIQEVYAQSWSNKFGFGHSQTESLAQPGGFNWLFCPTRYRWLRENRGNAILTKLPISSWQTYPLPDQSGISFRNMTVANFQWQGKSCYFINTHLYTGKGKSEQLNKVLEEFEKYQRVILVGDFNSQPDNALLVDYFAESNAIDAIQSTDIDLNEQDRIDWIITKGWKINSGKVIEKGVSDHPYYEINLELLT